MIKRILIKLPRKTRVDGREVVLSKFEKHHVKDLDKDYHTKHGIIKKNELKKKDGSVIKLEKESFVIFSPDFIDQYKQVKRLAQIIMLKDIGFIIAETGLNRDSIVLDAGLGSGALACFLAKIVKKVIGYEIEDDNIAVVKENMKELGIKNLEVKKGNVYDENQIKENNIDVFTLDVPEPWKAIKTAEKVLKIGGFLISYSPNLNQVQKFVDTLTDKFLIEKTVEVIEREWTVDEKRLRPKTKDVGHTGFLTVARKIK